MMNLGAYLLTLAIGITVACGSASSSVPATDETDASLTADAQSVSNDGTPGGKAGRCTDTFGNSITAAFGRLDGILEAVVTPADQQCPRPNSTHVVLEIQSMGARYRMVASVISNREPRELRFKALAHPLLSPAFADGWHTGLQLDYVADLGLHSADFEAVPKDALVARVNSALTVGAPVSVYASTDKGGASAHLVHRNGAGTDGAIVVGPTSAAPTWLLFHFAEQAF